MPSVEKTIITALAVATVMGITACQPPAPQKVTLKDIKDKRSYSIGFNIGKNISAGMKQEDVDVNPAVLAAGIQDAFETSTPGKPGDTTNVAKQLMTEAEMQSVMADFQKEMQAKTQEKEAKADAEAKVIGDQNIKEGADFLAANKTKEGVKTTASGLQYKIISHGKGTQSPKSTDTVTVNYRGTLINGTEFDSSAKQGKPVTFPVGQVIPGWTEVLQLMKEGDKFQVFIPSSLAYGEHSPSPDIGPNSTLIFDIELLGIEKTPAASSK